MGPGNEVLYSDLAGYVSARLDEHDRISGERIKALEAITAFVVERIKNGTTARMIFICTHNSRRSHLAQVWAQTAAQTFSVPGVETFSGGTEATAFNPRAVAALRRAGFRIDAADEGDNPVYEVRCGPESAPLRAFSKAYDQPPNPGEGFAAVMTCSDADAACPVVAGADQRFAIPYEDPKISDGSEEETEIYDKRCAQIAREMLYVFSEVAGEGLTTLVW